MAGESTIDVKDVIVTRIHADEDFNCRGHIPPSSVLDLAQDIRVNGLQTPITIHEYDDEHRERTGKDYRIVAGHRRYTAVTEILHWTTVPSIIKKEINETAALILNLGENLQREGLNILQEARALKRLKDAGLSQLDVAKALRMERPWVQTRYYVLDFPPDIQDEIANGMLNQAQIHELHSLPQDLWYEAVRKIKDAKIKAGTKRLRVSIKEFKKPDPATLLKAKPRKGDEVGILLDHFMEAGHPNLATAVLAWCLGTIPTIEVLKAYKEEMDIIGCPYHIPTQGISGL